MAKITSLAELTEVADDDLFVVVHKSDTSMADSGTDKKVKKSSLAKSLLDFFYPVGTIYETTSTDLDTTTKMNAHFGGTWEFYGAGRVLVAKSSDTEFDTIGKTGGEKTHTLTVAEMPSHNHSVSGTYTDNPFYVKYQNDTTYYGYYDDTNGGLGKYLSVANSVASQGGGGAHNNLQPYIVVYRYRRTA
jgi:hypothetical protein